MPGAKDASAPPDRRACPSTSPLLCTVDEHSGGINYSSDAWTIDLDPAVDVETDVDVETVVSPALFEQMQEAIDSFFKQQQKQ